MLGVALASPAQADEVFLNNGGYYGWYEVDDCFKDASGNWIGWNPTAGSGEPGGDSTFPVSNCRETGAENPPLEECPEAPTDCAALEAECPEESAWSCDDRGFSCESR